LQKKKKKKKLVDSSQPAAVEIAPFSYFLPGLFPSWPG